MEARLTFPRIFARQDYWREFPPPSVLLRAIAVGLGVYRPSTPSGEARAKLREMFPSGKI